MPSQCAAPSIPALPNSSPKPNRPSLILASSFLIAALGCGNGVVYYPAMGYGYGGGFGYGYGYGYISTAAGDGRLGSSGNGSAAVNAQLTAPSGIAVDPSGNIYIADAASNTIRKVAAGTGIIANYAGRVAAAGSAAQSAVRGYSGDNGLAINAEFNSPSALALDSANNLYVVDQSNNVIRRISASTGLVTTMAGGGSATQGTLGDNGPATAARLNHPSGIAFDPSGNLYIADTNNNRIREVALSTGVITTIAGTGSPGYAGDGEPATGAQLYHPS